MNDGDAARGTKRPADLEPNGSGAVTPVSFEDLRPANFHARPLGGAPSTSRRRASTATSSSSARASGQAAAPSLQAQLDSAMFNSPPYQPAPVQGYEAGHQTYDIIHQQDLSQFQLPQNNDLQELCVCIRPR